MHRRKESIQDYAKNYFCIDRDLFVNKNSTIFNFTREVAYRPNNVSILVDLYKYHNIRSTT